MRRNAVFLFCISLLVLVSCRSTTTGNEGELTFTYDSDDALFDFNKPIAVGAFLDLIVAEVGTGAAVTVTAASTDEETALAVTGFEGQIVTLEGVADGNVLITVEATLPDGTTVSDGVNMLVRVPEVQLLAHTCGASGGAYLTGSQVYVPYDLEMMSGQSVIGYGYYPVTSSDEALLSRDTTWDGRQYMRFDILAAGSATLTSDVDDTTLDFTLVDEGSIDGVIDPIAFVLEDIDVGDTNPFYVLPTTGGTTICQANATLTVRSDTPTTCDVRATGVAALAGDEQWEHGWFEIEGLEAGECMYTVTYPNGAMGAGVSAQYSYMIQP